MCCALCVVLGLLDKGREERMPTAREGHDIEPVLELRDVGGELSVPHREV